MEPVLQRRAIAEACGWSYNIEGVYESWFDPAGSEWQVMHGWQTYKDGTDILPDYLGDLNAMHEAEKILTDEQYHSALFLHQDDDPCYRNHLQRITSHAVPAGTEARAESASSTQRAEAFLKCLGLWKS